MNTVYNKPMKVLSEEDVKCFIEKGYVIIRNAFEKTTATALANEVWNIIPEDQHDRSTWTRPAVEIQDLLTSGPISDLFTTRYVQAIDDLLGEGKWYTNRDSFGWVPLRFPRPAGEQWQPPLKGWHVDGIKFQHHLSSPEQGLAGMEMLSDILPGGGGTALRIGSHKHIARILHERGDAGISYRDLCDVAESSTDFPVEEATGNAGDVLWMHPFLIHARSPNVTNNVRVASNRTISLYEHIRPLEATESEMSLLELSIKKALI
ncbi:phytanoyl-CoA dioxygenase family protein [Chitinophaga sp. Hz27]|uniref:phytanoyl-CoA dioxygenase family protein n=1 Tax=Chitinophaga sp. Hz27 TaxID=3347169 RepID=UPI0035DA0291